MSNKRNTGLQQHLLQVCFESPIIFEHNAYFNYNGIDFKLVKGTKQFQDVLCCIIDIKSSTGPEFDKEKRKAENIAFQFLSCLSWELKTRIIYSPSGGRGWRREYGGLSRVTRRICNARPREILRVIKGISIFRLPKIDNKYKAHAVNLFREAKAANSLYYQFLCYWKILEIYPKKEKETHGKSRKSIDWINDTIKQNRWILERAHFNEQLLGNKTIGDYLRDECRHAIAHVMPKHKLKPDSGESLAKVNIANRIMYWLVDIFMKRELELDFKKNEKDNYLFLKKKRGKAIPEFVSYKNYPCVLW